MNIRPSRCLPVAGLVLALATSAHAAGKPARAQVQIGVCSGPSRLEAAKAAGYDYVELGVRDLAALSDDDFAKVKADAHRLGVATPVANLFLPNELKVTGPEIDPAKQEAYVTKALDRAAAMGIKVVVFGSGGARKVPDGFARDEAWKQLVDFGRRAARIAAKRRITLAVEPLRAKESNIVNTAGEGLELVQAVKHPNFQLMVDFYHLASEKEDAAIIVKAARHIRHFHVANPNGRAYPKDAAEYDYAPFFDAVRAIKFRGGISIEGNSDDFPGDSAKSIAFLRAALASEARKPTTVQAKQP